MRITFSATVVHRHGVGSCAACPSRASCRKLCSEADAWANQDYRPQRELTIGMPDPTVTVFDIETSETPKITETEAKIFTLLIRGHERDEICNMLDISNVTLRKHISNMRSKYSQILLR
jgi:DNA-binding NarL/FixJ family response regulator